MTRRELLKRLVVAAIGVHAKPVQTLPTMVRHYKAVIGPDGILSYVSWNTPIGSGVEIDLEFGCNAWNPDYIPRYPYHMIKVSQEEVFRLFSLGHPKRYDEACDTPTPSPGTPLRPEEAPAAQIGESA